MMGFAAWLAAGVAALLAARIVPIQRRSFWLEAIVALLASLVAGTAATALDFGGWSEPDPRAFFFALSVALAALALLRAISLYRRPTDC